MPPHRVTCRLQARNKQPLRRFDLPFWGSAQVLQRCHHTSRQLEERFSTVLLHRRYLALGLLLQVTAPIVGLLSPDPLIQGCRQEPASKSVMWMLVRPLTLGLAGLPTDGFRNLHNRMAPLGQVSLRM